jgi:hypothetical protein
MACTHTAENLGIVLEFSPTLNRMVHHACPDDVVKSTEGWRLYKFDNLNDVEAVLKGEGKDYPMPVRRALLRHLAWHGRGEGLGDELGLVQDDADWLALELADARIYNTIALQVAQSSPNTRGGLGTRVHQEIKAKLAGINTVGGGAGVQALSVVTESFGEALGEAWDITEDVVVARWLGAIADELRGPLVELGWATAPGNEKDSEALSTLEMSVQHEANQSQEAPPAEFHFAAMREVWEGIGQAMEALKAKNNLSEARMVAFLLTEARYQLNQSDNAQDAYEGVKTLYKAHNLALTAKQVIDGGGLMKRHSQSTVTVVATKLPDK